MKYLFIFIVSIQAFACKPETSQKAECDVCIHNYGKCMAKTVDEVSETLTEKDRRDLVNDCRNVLQVCSMKNQCLNKE